MRFGRFLGAVVLVGLLASLGLQHARAQTPQANQSFTLKPGGKATITFQAFCLDFGQSFPQAVQAPNALAEDKVRAALAYIQTNNLAADATKALDAQYALWRLRGATSSPAGGDQAKAIVNAATTAPAAPQGTSLIDAAKANQVRLTVSSWQPIGDKVQVGTQTDYFYGSGTLTVENTSQQELTLYMPVGTLFPPGAAGQQTMVAYATNTQVSNPQPEPQQLPNTGAGDALPLPLLAIGLVLVLIGLMVRKD